MMRLVAACLMIIPMLCLHGALAGATEADYQVGAGDVLRITVYDNPDLTSVTRVDNNGDIIFPLIGSTHVGGLTTAEASRAVANKLDGEYIINPQVSIFIEQFRSKKVVIIGEIVKPGLYELSGPTSLLELISLAGGPTKGAGQQATITRIQDGNEANKATIEVNVEELLRSGHEAIDVPLQDGDTVTLSKAGVVYVTGQVRRPAAYTLEPDTTVIKAITMAGGFTELASQGRVKIIRKVNGKEQVLEKVSLHEKIMPEDVMVVPESFF